MKIKLTFIVLTPFTQRDYDRFGIEILENNGFEVDVLDLTHLFHLQNGEGSDSPKIVRVDSYRDFESYIKDNQYDVIYIKVYGESSKLLKINMLLSKYRVQTMLFNTNILPIAINKQSLLYKIRYILSSFSFGDIFGRIYYLLNKHKIKNNDFVLIGGTEGEYCSGTDEQTRYIYGHTLDYDIYRSQRDLPSLISHKYVVFLDENLPYHPDEKLSGSEKYLERIAPAYYQKLNYFFDFIELEYDLKVVVAAHPSAEYERIGNPFDGRECIKGKTNQLIQHAEFCLGHFSTSINFAILHQKPVLFITLQEIDYLFGDFITKFSEILGNKKLFIDDIDSLGKITSSIDYQCYEEYVNKYIKDLKNHDNEGSNWEIVSNYLIENRPKESSCVKTN